MTKEVPRACPKARSAGASARVSPFELGLAWVAALSLVTFLQFGWDKSRARRGKPRIPERGLLAGSVLGGAAGGLLAMLVFRHKVRKPSFWLLHFAALALHARVLVTL